MAWKTTAIEQEFHLRKLCSERSESSFIEMGKIFIGNQKRHSSNLVTA